jgi:hypothetical protein
MSLIPYDMFRAIYPSSNNTTYSLLGDIDIIIIILLLLLTANGFIPGGSGATIRHNHKTTHITLHNTPHSK